MYLQNGTSLSLFHGGGASFDAPASIALLAVGEVCADS